MSPRKTEPKSSAAGASRKGPGPSQDRKRVLDDSKHHPAKAAAARRTSHKPQKKSKLPPRHKPHSHPHGDEIGPHETRPSPIKPAKKITRTGAKRR